MVRIRKIFKYLKMAKNKIRRLTQKIIKKIAEGFLFETSIYGLSKVAKSFFIFSVGFDEFYHGNTNFKRLIISILICTLMWIITFYYFFILITNFAVYDLIPISHFKVVVSFGLLVFVFISIIKTDIYVSAEIKKQFNLCKVIYFLMSDWKLKHKLTDNNYKRLIRLTRFWIICLINYVAPTISILMFCFHIEIAIASRQLFWIVGSIITLPILINGTYLICVSFCMICLVFSYFKMRFTQINYCINHCILSIIPNGKSKLISKRKERQLNKLINEHNLVSLEVDEMSSFLRLTIASAFIILSFLKIISLYIFIKSKETFVKILFANAFLYLFFFGFGMTFLFSKQIQYAHQCYKLIHLVVCRYKIRFRFRLKVS